MTSLNQEDIGLLMEGLQAIEKAESLSESMGMLMGGLLAPPDKREAFMSDEQRRRDIAKRARNTKVEDALLLRAKLVQMRRELDGADADRVLAEARV